MLTAAKKKRRLRFTIGRLMIGIAAIAGILALPGVAGLLAGLLFLASLHLIGARWIVEGGTRNRPLAAGTFWAVALCVNLIAVAFCLPPDYLILGGAIFPGTLFVGIPAIVAFGIAWVQLMDGRGAVPPRSTEVAGILVFLLALLPMLTIGTLWPLRVAFLTSRPALERLADQIAAGKTVVFPQHAGWFQINDAAVDPVSGNLGLMIEPDRSHPAGFVRLGPGPAAGPNVPICGSDLHVGLGWQWSYRQDD
jgi:hypothetical protein